MRSVRNGVKQRVLALALVLGFAALQATAPPARAECLFLDHWPSFDEVAPVAETVMLGEVVEDRTPDMQGGRLGHFGFLVQEVYRGDVNTGSIVDVAYLPPSPPPALCPTYLRPMLGEILVIAIGAPGPEGSTLNSAAWLRGAPDEMMQGLGKITRGDLRAMFDLPTTDASPAEAYPHGDLTSRWIFVVVLALTAGLFALHRTGRRGFYR
jgi:hypothetical protein